MTFSLHVASDSERVTSSRPRVTRICRSAFRHRVQQIEKPSILYPIYSYSQSTGATQSLYPKKCETTSQPSIDFPPTLLHPSHPNPKNPHHTTSSHAGTASESKYLSNSLSNSGPCSLGVSRAVLTGFSFLECALAKMTSSSSRLRPLGSGKKSQTQGKMAALKTPATGCFG